MLNIILSDNRDYQEWKNEIQSDWMKRNLSLVQQIYVLTHYVNHGIPAEGLRARSWSKAHLYSYNLVRELLNEPPASTDSEIDKKWIDDLEKTIDPYKVAEDEGLNAPLLGAFIIKRMLFTRIMCSGIFWAHPGQKQCTKLIIIGFLSKNKNIKKDSSTKLLASLFKCSAKTHKSLSLETFSLRR